jgi:outer membrane protein OmpA-like peptidoglycan-associated protein/PHD/YefM family antitoxin component YafN of YafNO toxin-antitoxin module
MSIIMDIQSGASFRDHAAAFLRHLKETGRPMVLTVNGKGAAVVPDADAYERLRNGAADSPAPVANVAPFSCDHRRVGIFKMIGRAGRARIRFEIIVKAGFKRAFSDRMLLLQLTGPCHSTLSDHERSLAMPPPRRFWRSWTAHLQGKVIEPLDKTNCSLNIPRESIMRSLFLAIIFNSLLALFSPAWAVNCPENFQGYAGTSAPVACTCSPEAVTRAVGSVWGADIYPATANVCRAARHAGVVDLSGGAVMIVPETGRDAYPGVTRNGVESSNYGAYGGSFSFRVLPAETGSNASTGVTDNSVSSDNSGVHRLSFSSAALSAVANPVQQPIGATLRQRGEVQLYVRFRTCSAELDPETLSVLQELLAVLMADPTLNLGLIGHTDNVGPRDFNRTLSYHRAEAVRFWLASRGVAPTRLSVDGRGFDEPLADNETEQGRATNRRVQAKRL